MKRAAFYQGLMLGVAAFVSSAAAQVPEMVEPQQCPSKEAMAELPWLQTSDTVFAECPAPLSGSEADKTCTEEPEVPTIIIPKGASARQVGALLKQKGLIKHPVLFRMWVLCCAGPAGLRAGEFALPPEGASTYEVMKILTTEKPFLRPVTIPEGRTTHQIMQIIKNHPSLVGPMPAAPPEGSLLPETYLVTYGHDRVGLVAHMREKMDRVLDELWCARDPKIPVKTKREAVILASIVEKETGLDAERPRVAAVLHNRIRKKMKLQMDPTVIYGITHGKGELGRGITKQDLKTPTPYNTYVISGLPAGPICNPGLASLKAILNPTPGCQDLFFVGNGTGGHTFSKTHNEHKKHVCKLREIEKSREAV